MSHKSHSYYSVSSSRAPIRNTADYSPFGIQLDGRTLSYVPPAPAPPSVTVVYQHKFDDNPSTHPYTTAPNQLNTKLTNVSWTNSQSSWTNFAGFTGKAIATNSATPDTTRLYLNLTVNSGFMLDVKSYSFYHRSSTTGYTNYQLLVNGMLVGSGSIFVSSGSTLQSTGTINVANAVAGLTGSVTVTLKLFGGSNGNNATFRLDDFTLNGYTQEVQVYAESYRRGFNGMEKDDEVKGGGNSYTTEFRQYDARVGRWSSRDSKESKYPMDSPFMAFGNCPISVIDGDGREKIIIVGSENRKFNLTFVLPGMKAAREIMKCAGDEKVTLMLCKAGYTDSQMKRIQKYVNKNNVAIQVVTSSNDIVNYVNNKSLSNEQSGRKEDPISEVVIFAHGKPGELMFGYHQPNVEENYSFTKEEVLKLNKSAFKSSASIISFACRTGAGKEVNDVTRDTNPEKSLGQDMANHLGITVLAYQCRSDYDDILSKSLLETGLEKIGVYKDNTYKPNGGCWDTNTAIDNISYPHEGITPSMSPGMTVYKKGEKPVIVDSTSDYQDKKK